MATVSCSIYYGFPGISTSNPLADEKSLIDIERDLDWTTSKLEDLFSNLDDRLAIDRVRESGTMMVTISSNISENRILEKLKEILEEVGLFGKVKTK